MCVSAELRYLNKEASYRCYITIIYKIVITVFIFTSHTEASLSLFVYYSLRWCWASRPLFQNFLLPQYSTKLHIHIVSCYKTFCGSVRTHIASYTHTHTHTHTRTHMHTHTHTHTHKYCMVQMFDIANF